MNLRWIFIHMANQVHSESYSSGGSNDRGQRDRPKLTPETSPLSPDKWKVFVEDGKTGSYAYYLPHSELTKEGQHVASAATDSDVRGTSHAVSEDFFGPDRLAEWFRQLHPASYGDIAGCHAWTDAEYKGKLLLRKTAWCVLDEVCACEYGYSDTWQPILRSERMKRTLEEITAAVSKIVGCSGELNCVNLNYYPRGGGVGFHADDEFLFDGLNRNTRIISLSLCAPPPSGENGDFLNETKEASASWGARRFQIRRKGNKHKLDVSEILLQHGDIMTMEGMFQKYYLHSVWPGDSTGHKEHPLAQGERINLTWRTIVKHLDGSDACRGIVCPLSTK